MARWTVTFQDEPGMIHVRGDRARRKAHIAFVRAHPELEIGGAHAMCPMQDFPGALWTVEADSPAEVEALIQDDPYFTPALRRFDIRSWDAARLAHGLLI